MISLKHVNKQNKEEYFQGLTILFLFTRLFDYKKTEKIIIEQTACKNGNKFAHSFQHQDPSSIMQEIL